MLVPFNLIFKVYFDIGYDHTLNENILFLIGKYLFRIQDHGSL